MAEPAERVIITGASSGLGEALARAYARRGASLGLLARREEKLTVLAGELTARHGVRCAILVADVADPQAMQRAGEAFLNQVGVPDIVIANAGISVGTLTQEVEDLPAFRRVLETNVLGLLHSFAPFLPAMLARGQGKLVGIASVAGIRGLPGAGAYSASKAAAIAYLESLRVELRGSGIRVITLAPGYIATPMTEKNPYPMPFLISAEEAARRMLRVIDTGRSYAVIPWPMALLAKLLRLMPNPLFDALFAHAGRKPRGLPL